MDIQRRIAQERVQERVPTTCNGGSPPLSRVSPDRALALRQLTILAPASGIEVSAQQTARSDPKFR
jgi:hypothetical protein